MLMTSMQHAFGIQVDYRFDVHFTQDVFAPANTVLLEALRRPAADRPARALVFVDRGSADADHDLIARIHRWFAVQDSGRCQLAAPPEIVAGGEAVKADWSIVDLVGRLAVEASLCRHSYVIIIGGGAVLDAVGFGASLVHRGLRQIRIPTTVLAQADAGLGVKNAINGLANKNFYGTFTPPEAIINDRQFLRHLDDRSWRAGVAEAFKVAIIKDATFLDDLLGSAARLRARDLDVMARVVERCALLHLDHITTSGDPFEKGSSRPLDFGHWSAHRLEVLSRHRLQHGEAVAIGVALDCCYAVEIGRLTPVAIEPILDAMAVIGFALWDDCLDLRNASGARRVLEGLEQFREHLGGALTLAMPNGLGQREDITSFDAEAFERAARNLRARRPRLSRLAGSAVTTTT